MGGRKKVTMQFRLIGYPIKHSLSPWIHNRFLRKANIEGKYEILEIESVELLEEKMFELKNTGINGYNVTVPYKEKIIPLLDELDEQAKRIGAVNTVLNRNGKWIGYNTDSIGYVRSLETKYPDVVKDKSKRILILGAGGAARGIYCGLVFAGYSHVDIANRTINKALEIAALQDEKTETNVMTLIEAEEQLHQYDVIIQTTSVGMNPNRDDTIISLHNVKPGSIVSDIVYQPIKTKFLKSAEDLGANIHYGHTMLLYQALYAFEIWTGNRIDIDQMDDELQQVLEGR